MPPMQRSRFHRRVRESVRSLRPSWNRWPAVGGGFRMGKVSRQIHQSTPDQLTRGLTTGSHGCTETEGDGSHKNTLLLQKVFDTFFTVLTLLKKSNPVATTFPCFWCHLRLQASSNNDVVDAFQQVLFFWSTCKNPESKVSKVTPPYLSND